MPQESSLIPGNHLRSDPLNPRFATEPKHLGFRLRQPASERRFCHSPANDVGEWVTLPEPPFPTRTWR